MRKGRQAEAFYSPREREVLRIIREAKGRRLTTSEIIERVFGRDAPFNARQSVLATLSTLSRKIESREKFKLQRSARRGPKPVSFWLEEHA